MDSRSPEPIFITILRARNMRGVKGDQVNLSVKVEFWEKVLGDSPKVECSAETPAEFNYNTTVNCTFEDASFLDELAHRPVILTLTEYLPKEKKQKEEKTQPLGQCTFDLLPLIRGAEKHLMTLTVHPLTGSPLEGMSPDGPVPEVDIQISVENPLVTETMLKDNNLLSVTVESLYSPPEAFAPGGPQGGYTVAMPMALNAERDFSLVYPAGMVKLGGEKDPLTRQKKWVIPGSAQGGATYIPNNFIPAEEIEEEDGDFRGKEDREHRQTSEAERNRVSWNMERCCYLQNSAIKSLKDKIAKTRVWPVEIFRIAAGGGGKGAKKPTGNRNQSSMEFKRPGSLAAHDEEGGIGYHGVAYVNFSPLLYPGVRRVRGAYRVYPFIESEYVEKTKRRSGLADEASRIANSIINRNTASPMNKKGGGDKAGEKKGGEKKHKPPPVAAAGTLDSESGKAGEGGEVQDGPVNVEGQQYADSRSYIILEFKLDRPLVPKKDAEMMSQYVAEYIPARPMFPKRTNCAEKAVEDYHSQVAEIASKVLDEFREMFAEQIQAGEVPSTPEAVEQMRQELMYELNSSGKYFAFKEQLKYAVIKIVREKYLRTTSFTDQEQLQLFLRDLFVYLVDELQTGLSRVISLVEKTPVPPPITESDQLLHFAREAEMNENHAWAARYYQERIARDRNRPQHWFDYGTYCLGSGDVGKAEECFRESIAIDQKHINGLMMYGVVCALQENHEAAETFLEAATAHDSKNVIAWTMLGLFYDALGNDIGAEMALMEANKLNQPEVPTARTIVTGGGDSVGAGGGGESSGLAVAEGGTDDQPLHSGEQSGPAYPYKQSPIPPSATVKSSIPPLLGGGGVGIVTTAATVTLSPRHSSIAAPTPSPSQIVDDIVTDGVEATPAHPQATGGSRQSSAHGSDRVTVGGAKKSIGGAPPVGTGMSSKRSITGSRGKQSLQTLNVGEDGAIIPDEPTKPEKSIYMQTALFLIEMKAASFTERALAHELVALADTGITAEYQLAHARFRLQTREFELAERSLEDVLLMEFENSEAWAHLGHLKYLVGDVAAAKDCYQRALAFETPPVETHSILLRLASIYLQEENYQLAKTTFLLACKRAPSCVSWLGVGIASYRLGELTEAEDALSEANILNNRDSEVWGYLALLCLKTGRKIEAEQSFKYALKVGLEDKALLEELRQTHESLGFGDPQFS